MEIKKYELNSFSYSTEPGLSCPARGHVWKESPVSEVLYISYISLRLNHVTFYSQMETLAGYKRFVVFVA